MLYKIGDIIINLKNVTMIKNCKDFLRIEFISGENYSYVCKNPEKILNDIYSRFYFGGCFMAFVVPVREDLSTPINLNEDIIEKLKDTKFMIVDDIGSDIYQNDVADVWLSNGLFISGKVTRISDISIEIIIEQEEKLYIPYKKINRILKNFEIWRGNYDFCSTNARN